MYTHTGAQDAAVQVPILFIHFNVLRVALVLLDACHEHILKQCATGSVRLSARDSRPNVGSTPPADRPDSGRSHTIGPGIDLRTPKNSRTGASSLAFGCSFPSYSIRVISDRKSDFYLAHDQPLVSAFAFDIRDYLRRQASSALSLRLTSYALTEYYRARTVVPSTRQQYPPMFHPESSAPIP